MFGLSPSELAVIAIIVLLIFGARRLPEIGKGLGGAIREFRNIKKEISSDKTIEPAQEGKEAHAEKGVQKSLGAKLGEKVLEQAPLAKKVVDAKNNIDKIKQALK
ncbi:Sec-independent protein translocase protein TatA [uncultured Desulfobacterium sp.]|uniref:Sec-independent protein translocase protein TatA n=1 Tax=uncultured Desulfobacterium sp. TaxID=201089 RepID=A0A445N000_9BACT|nr:Sec-independent protein translocase protein TatA [uncultured Desulfobacterium sp.]